jgi:predicted TIM-barrel fold metal-dependent hydrolase
MATAESFESRRYTVVSSDTHAGADLRDYKPYLRRDLHEEFEAWVSSFSDGWQDYDVEQAEAHDEGIRIGVSSFMSPYNWDSDKRLMHLEGQGIAAEVLFPNTVPPFYPTGVISAAAPATPKEYYYRWAGVQAHNRWLAEFCSATPGRRAGIAQVFLTDIDDAVAEVRWAKAAGLAGVIIPGDHHRLLVNLFDLRLDPFWSVCEELDFPVHRHTTAVSDPETAESGAGGSALGFYESSPFVIRTLPQLMIGGVFHRHPKLKFVITEATAAWAPPLLASLDAWFEAARTKGTKVYTGGHRAVEGQDMLPSEYFARNCYLGSFLAAADIAARHKIGVDRLMWGSDYPHHEGTYPHTDLALRANFSDVPENEVCQILGTTAGDVYNLDMRYLQSISDRIGPTVAEVAKPLKVEDYPKNTACTTFVDLPEAFVTA